MNALRSLPSPFVGGAAGGVSAALTSSAAENLTCSP